MTSLNFGLEKINALEQSQKNQNGNTAATNGLPKVLDQLPSDIKLKQVQAKTPQQNSANNGNTINGFRNSNQGNNNMILVNDYLSKQDMANRTFYTDKQSVKSGITSHINDTQVNCSVDGSMPLIRQKNDVNTSSDKNPLNTTINNNNFIITINKNYTGKQNLIKSDMPHQIVDQSMQNLQKVSSKNLKILPQESRSLSRNRRAPSSLRNLSNVNEEQLRTRNSRSNLNQTQNLQMKPGVSAQGGRFQNSKFVNEKRVMMSLDQDNLRQNLNHSVEYNQQQNFSLKRSIDEPSPLAMKYNHRYMNDQKQSFDVKNEKIMKKNLTALNNGLSQQNKSGSSQNLQQNPLDAYKSIPIMLIPKRKKQTGKLKQINQHDLELLNSSHMLSNNNQIQRDSNAGSKIIEEEESVNESESYQSNAFASLNQDDKNNYNSNNFRRNGLVIVQAAKLKSRFKKLTLSLRKNQQINTTIIPSSTQLNNSNLI
ncbi:UNKNOWN [Stylonychia lemnae]|uniref:Uncharacterized protein n=1 Tax=Stylonychia lemnae TaxID=5949 RepID=A0A078AVC4_STYLE|nr:UNKNOWN [Stylonychia lemnae]|eukprot:CDW85986.1 UNKNOWN [Stylonychia lemnae]